MMSISPSWLGLFCCRHYTRTRVGRDLNFVLDAVRLPFEFIHCLTVFLLNFRLTVPCLCLKKTAAIVVIAAAALHLATVR